MSKMFLESFIPTVAERLPAPSFNTLLNEIAGVLQGPYEARVKNYGHRKRVRALGQDGSQTLIEVQVKPKASTTPQDGARYDFLERVQLLEGLVDGNQGCDLAFAVFVTDNHLYWNKSSDPDPIDPDLHLFEGRIVGPGTLDWSPHAKAGSKKNREKPIHLRSGYAAEWRVYSKSGGREFRYLCWKIQRSEPLLVFGDEESGLSSTPVMASQTNGLNTESSSLTGEQGNQPGAHACLGYNPENVDQRRAIMQQIRERRGQQQFRDTLRK